MSQKESTKFQNEKITPPPSVVGLPWTPPPSDEKAFPQVHRVLELFERIRAGTHTSEDPEVRFQLGKGEYNHLEHKLECDRALQNYVQAKLRRYYNQETRLLIVCIPHRIHESFLRKVDKDIQIQLDVIGSGSGKKAKFAQNMDAWGSAVIEFKDSKSSYEPDVSFGHPDAKFPGVIIEVGFSQKQKSLNRLAENYLMDSQASVRVVVCVKIAYREESQKATFSVWRPQLFNTPDGPSLRAVLKVEDEVFRDDKGNAVDGPGVELQLSDFTYEELAQAELGDEGARICISGRKLCEYLNIAERGVRRGGGGAQGMHHIDPNTKVEKRSPSPEEELNTSDEEKFAQEEAEAEAHADRERPYRGQTRCSTEQTGEARKNPPRKSRAQEGEGQEDDV